MSVTNQQFAQYLQQYLACEQFKDHIYNGLQVSGKTNIKNICTAVTISQDVIKQAQQLQADALLVHHGLFWRGEDTIITGMKRARIAALLASSMNLFAYHLPLDCHLEIGNNICVANKLNIQVKSCHTAAGVPNLLWYGEFAKPIAIAQLQLLCSTVFHRDPIVILGKSDLVIHKMAWCTGSAYDFIEQAAALGADLFLSGEVAERTFYQAQELGIHYFSCGHHATELFGIQALGQHLALKYDLQHYFIDSGNPI